MKQSQIVVLSAFALIALFMILTAGIARVALSQLAPDARERSREAPGEQTTRSLNLDGFSGIEVHGIWNVTLVQSDQWSVELSFPENYEEDLRVRVQGDRLVVADTVRNGNRGERRFTARVSMPELTSAEVSGAGTLDFSGFSGDRLKVGISGAGQVEGDAGRYGALDLAVSGAGRVDLRRVAVVDALVNLSGAGRVTLTMDGGALSGSISGAGSVEYYGSTTEQRVSTSGAGRVNQVN